jgi:hypothetical protein
LVWEVVSTLECGSSRPGVHDCLIAELRLDAETGEISEHKLPLDVETEEIPADENP